MSDITADLKVREDLIMQAWMRADKGGVKKFIERDFTMIIGGERPQLLDRPSFLEACDSRFRLEGFRFGEAYANRYKNLVWFTAAVELELRLAGKKWTGGFWITDLWRKSAFGRGWKIAERSLSKAEPDEEYSLAIRQLQLWR
ncbi:MAG: hypothetical protein AAGK01_07580 [Pseudomonadota bacterium]